MTALVLVLAAWTALALPVALWLGPVLRRNRERHEAQPGWIVL